MIDIKHGKKVIMIKDRTYKFTVTLHDWNGMPADPEHAYAKMFDLNKQLIESFDITANKIGTGIYEWTHTFDSEDSYIIEFSDSVDTTTTNLRFIATVKFM